MSFILGVVIVGSFSAQLMSHLAVIKISLPFNNMEEVFNTDFTVGTLNGSAVLGTFRSAPEGTTHRRVWDDIMSKNLETGAVKSLEEGLSLAKEQDYALVWNTDAVYTINKDNCDFRDIPQDIATWNTVIVWTKNLPYRQIFRLDSVKKCFLYKKVQQGLSLLLSVFKKKKIIQGSSAEVNPPPMFIQSLNFWMIFF